MNFLITIYHGLHNNYVIEVIIIYKEVTTVLTSPVMSLQYILFYCQLCLTNVAPTRHNTAGV